MSTPDNDPQSKLHSRSRPTSRSGTIANVATVWAGMGAFGCLFAFAASFFPGVKVDGSVWWFLLGAVVFSAAGLFFYAVGKALR